MQERALSDAGDNAGEISRFLDRYDGEKKEIAKIHRYALLGNAVSVPVVREVAARIRQTTTLF